MCDDCVTRDSKRWFAIFHAILTKGIKTVEKVYKTRARVSVSSNLILDLLSRELDTRIFDDEISCIVHAGHAVFRKRRSAIVTSKTFQHHVKKRRREKKSAETGNHRVERTLSRFFDAPRVTRKYFQLSDSTRRG